MKIKSLRLDGFLSFSPGSEPVELKDLNVLIGANGAGKSNFIDALAMIRSMSRQPIEPVIEGGGADAWIWKGSPKCDEATVDVVFENVPSTRYPLRHIFSFRESAAGFVICDERVEYEKPRDDRYDVPFFFYKYGCGNPVLSVKKTGEDGFFERQLRHEDLDPQKSILAQRKDPDAYPEITALAEGYDDIRIYRDWAIGRTVMPRQPQRADMWSSWLMEDFSNLALVLNNIRNDRDSERNMLDTFRYVYNGATDIRTRLEGGLVYILVREKNCDVPAARLSDGTLHFLSLLAILYNPKIAPVTCIEEPELGLHPDLIGVLAKAILFASERSQLIITTHSPLLLDALGESPDSIIVCEKGEDEGTVMKRLDSEDLKVWLDRYSLGTLWRRGDLGGNRW